MDRVALFSTRAAVSAVIVLFAAFLWLDVAAPAFVSFAVAIAFAIAWCIWLERHPAESEEYR